MALVSLISRFFVLFFLMRNVARKRMNLKCFMICVKDYARLFGKAVHWMHEIVGYNDVLKSKSQTVGGTGRSR